MKHVSVGQLGRDCVGMIDRIRDEGPYVIEASGRFGTAIPVAMLVDAEYVQGLEQSVRLLSDTAQVKQLSKAMKTIAESC